MRLRPSARLSLVAASAGALEHRPDAPPDQVARAAGVVQEGVHLDLEELREVIGVLRSDRSDAGRPQPVLAGVSALVAESRGAGTTVHLDNRVVDAGAAPDTTGRAAYRVVRARPSTENLLHRAVTWNDVLSPYPELVRAGFRRYASYRQAALAGLATNVVFGLLRVAVLAAVLAERGTVAGYDVGAAVTYVWLGQGLITVVLLWGDNELSQRIRTGDVVVDLGRPWDAHLAMLATDLGRAGYAVLVRLVPPVLVGVLFFPFRLPERATTWALFAASTVLAVVASFGVRFLLNTTAFWLLDARGVIAVWGVAGGVLSGLILPLAWFPAWAQAVLAWTPFPALFQTPIDVFIERGDVAAALGHQVVWAVALLVAGRIALARGARRLVVQGG